MYNPFFFGALVGLGLAVAVVGSQETTDKSVPPAPAIDGKYREFRDDFRDRYMIEGKSAHPRRQFKPCFEWGDLIAAPKPYVSVCTRAHSRFQ